MTTSSGPLSESAGFALCRAHGGGNNERVLFQRSVISKLNRVELEDKLYRAIESNVLLKKENNTLNEKLKLLNAKLVRLSEQLKRAGRENYTAAIQPFEKLAKDRDVRIEGLEKENRQLLQKMNTLRRQASVQQYLLALAKTKYSKKGANELAKPIAEERDSNKLAVEETENEKHRCEDDDKLVEEEAIMESSCMNTAGVLQSSDGRDYSSIITSNKEEYSAYQEEGGEKMKIFATQIRENKDVTTQTELTKLYYDGILKKLVEKEDTITELQKQLKVTQLKQRTMGQVEELLSIVNQKTIKNKKKQEDLTNAKSDENVAVQELHMERLNVQAQMEVNSQLLQKLSVIQARLDEYSITSAIVYSTAICDETSSPDTVKDLNTISVTQEDFLNDGYISLPVRNHPSSASIDKIESPSNNGNADEHTSKYDEINGTLSSDIELSQIRESSEAAGDISKQSSPPEDLSLEANIEDKGAKDIVQIGDALFGAQDEERKVDDATYNVLSNGSDADSTCDDCSSGQCLSDGEVPRESSPRSSCEDTEPTNTSSSDIYKKATKSPGHIIQESAIETEEIIAIEIKAEMALKAICEQIETCKMLMDSR